MADEVIWESEARLLRMLLAGAFKPKEKPIVSSSSMVLMGGSTDEPAELNYPEPLLNLAEGAGSTISVIPEGPACS